MGIRMIIAGGGTGGHLFPGFAVASEFLRRHDENDVLFVGTDKGIEAHAVPRAGYRFEPIPSQGIAGKKITARAKAAFMIPWSVVAAMRVLKRYKPDLAMGVGGYVSGPVLLAARILGVPCAIHEQNAAPGWTNRIAARFCSAVFVSFEKAAASFPSAAKKGRVFVVGNPIRTEIKQALQAPRPEGGDKEGGEKVRILVLGGSQGAHGLNLLVADAMAELAPDRTDNLKVRHQSGERDLEELRKKYEKTGLEVSVEAFINDMGEAYLDSDIIVSRAGAGAVAEIAMAGRPSILVPFPYATADHQADNARVLVDAGAALMMREGEIDSRSLAEALSSLLASEHKRKDMGTRAKEAARPEAAAHIVDHCLEIMRNRGEA